MAFQSHAPGHRGQSPPSAGAPRLVRLFAPLAAAFSHDAGNEPPKRPRPPRFPISGSSVADSDATACTAGRKQPYTDLRALERQLQRALKALSALSLDEELAMSEPVREAIREAVYRIALAGCHLDPRDFDAPPLPALNSPSCSIPNEKGSVAAPEWSQK